MWSCGVVRHAGAVSYLKSEHEVWHKDGSSDGPWREEVDRALREFDRVLAPGGVLLLLETQGTATPTPQRAGSWLYAHFREAGGLSERTVRTDYLFPNRAVALETLLFFFGRGVARRAEALLRDLPDERAPCIVPECTGMWWRRKLGARAGGGRDTGGGRAAPAPGRGLGLLRVLGVAGAPWCSWRRPSWRPALATALILTVYIVGATVIRSAQWRSSRNLRARVPLR
jgi:hypothetical protein